MSLTSLTHRNAYPLSSGGGSVTDRPQRAIYLRETEKIPQTDVPLYRATAHGPRKSAHNRGPKIASPTATAASAAISTAPAPTSLAILAIGWAR